MGSFPYVDNRPTGIKRSSRRAAKWMSEKGIRCRANCGRPLVQGQLVVVEERTNFFVLENRYHIWHHECHPNTVNREFAKMMRRAEELCA